MRIGMMSKHERRNIEKILTKLIAEQTLKRGRDRSRRKVLNSRAGHALDRAAIVRL